MTLRDKELFSWRDMFASLRLPQLCLWVQMASALDEDNALGGSSMQPFCPLHLQEDNSRVSSFKIAFMSELHTAEAGCQHRQLCTYTHRCCEAVWFGIGTRTSNCWLRHSVSSHLPLVYILTLLGCTARLRFSIHLSLSADERQEKHLLPVEVVTYRRERQRERERER